MSWFADNLPVDKHCFFGVEGGVSKDKYYSLNTNLKSHDSVQNVHKNFAIIAEKLGKSFESFATFNQGVSNKVIIIDEPQFFKQTADGAVTTNFNILLGVKTADCTPVLLADYKHNVIGVAHAGWRGAYKGIVENTVNLMLEKGAEIDDLSVAIGPCMQQESFEVKNDMRQIFIDISANNAKYFVQKNEECYLFDMSGYVEDKLRNLGIQNICNSHIDTYPLQNGYFSYRRNSKLNLIDDKGDYPTQYSVICL